MSAADSIILAALAQCNQLSQQHDDQPEHGAMAYSVGGPSRSTSPLFNSQHQVNTQSGALLQHQQQQASSMTPPLPSPWISDPVQYPEQQRHNNSAMTVIVTPRVSPTMSSRRASDSAVRFYQAIMSDPAAPGSSSHGHYDSLTPRRTQSDHQNRGLFDVPTTPIQPPTPSFSHDDLMGYTPQAGLEFFVESKSAEFINQRTEQATPIAGHHLTSFSTDNFRSSSRNTNRPFSSGASTSSACVYGIAVTSEEPGNTSLPATAVLSRHANSRKRQRPGYVCANCGDTDTVRWRISRLSTGHGELRVCNPCGIYERMHGIHRPQGMVRREKRKSRLSLTSLPALPVGQPSEPLSGKAGMISRSVLL